MALDESQSSLFLGSESITLTGKAYENSETFKKSTLNSDRAMWIHWTKSYGYGLSKGLPETQRKILTYSEMGWNCCFVHAQCPDP